MKNQKNNNRILQIQEVLKHELGRILLRGVEMPEETVVTVTRVVASGNLQEAKVYISVMPEERVRGVLKTLHQNVYEVQQALNERLKMRPVPRIQWVQETGGVQVQKVEELLEKIKKEVK